jgi:hypothetical protein
MMFRRRAGGRYTLNIQNVEKKLREARFFLDKMREYEREAFQDTEPFDFYLSAFLNAGMTVRTGFHVRQDGTRNAAITSWREQWQTSLNPNEEAIYDFMRQDRVAEVHGSGSSRSVKTEDIELFEGTNRPAASGTEFVAGPPDVRPLGSRPAPAYSFTIAGTKRGHGRVRRVSDVARMEGREV